MSDMWMAGSEVYDLMKKTVAKWHPHLVIATNEIAIVMREKASASASLGSSKKSSQVMDMIVESATGTGVKFVLEIPADLWSVLSDEKRESLMDHLLCYCGVEYKEETDETKYVIRKPELQLFKAEVRRHGVWMDISEEGDGCEDIAEKIENSIGNKEDSEIEEE